ncbi:MAG: LytR C-terminal domain-containing protein [Pseudonocardiaceae bacterium]
MSTPDGKRLWIAGLALVGVAVVAVLIGVVVATTRGESTSTTPPAAGTTPPAGTPAIPSTIPYPPTVAPQPAEPPVIAAPAPVDVGASAPVDRNDSRGQVRVYNNSTIRGLAARAAGDLTSAGWTVVEVGNYPSGTLPTTTVYYQEGTGQRADAEAIGSAFGMRVEPRFAGITNASPGLIVIVTNDYVSP